MGPVLKPNFTPGAINSLTGASAMPWLVPVRIPDQSLRAKRDGSIWWAMSASQAHCLGGEGVTAARIKWQLPRKEEQEMETQ